MQASISNAGAHPADVPSRGVNVALIFQSITVWAVVCLSVGAATLMYGLARPYMHDDSIFLIFSEEILKGRNPYEFYDNKLPGIFVLFAIWMKIFGADWWSGRVLSWLVMAATATLTAASLPAGFNAASRRWFGLLAFVILWFTEGSLVMTEAGVALFLALGLWVLSRNFLSPRAAVWSAVLFCIAATFKQVAYGLPLAYFVVALLAAARHSVPRVLAVRAAILHILAFVAACACVWAIYAVAGIAGVVWERAFLAMADYERRISLSSGVLLLVRTGWFILPAIALVLWRLTRGRLFRDPLLFQFCVLVAAGFSLAITKRFYAHYLLAAAPAYAILLAFGWRWFIAKRANLIFGGPVVVAIALLMLVVIATGAYLKRESLSRIAGLTDRTDTYSMAVSLGRYITGPEDRALIVDPGPRGIKAAAAYYYAGLRPPWSLLFFSNVPPRVLDQEVSRLPAILDDPHTKIVIIDRNRGFHPYWRPIPDEIRELVNARLDASFRAAPELGANNIYVRADAEPGAASIFNGPYANRSASGLTPR